MSRSRPTLYQFPISHYCEKARWALEFKKIEYDIVNLVPGPHRSTAKKLGAPHSHTPILKDGDKVLQGSEQIIDYLESKHPHPALTPTNAEAGSMAVEWARFAEKNIGVPLRLYFYQHILPNRRLATRLLTEDCPWWAKPAYTLMFPTVRKVMRTGMKINAENAEVAKQTLLRSFDQIENRLQDRQFLVDNRFTRADLAVISLLAPCWRAINDIPSELDDFIQSALQHKALVWAQEVYASRRHA
ncbi:MAG: glutathione S-transferase [Pseudomonadota bacterium]